MILSCQSPLASCPLVTVTAPVTVLLLQNESLPLTWHSIRTPSCLSCFSPKTKSKHKIIIIHRYIYINVLLLQLHMSGLKQILTKDVPVNLHFHFCSQIQRRYAMFINELWKAESTDWWNIIDQPTKVKT